MSFQKFAELDRISHGRTHGADEVGQSVPGGRIVVDGVDEAPPLELYSAADLQPMQLDQGRRDMVGAT